MGQLPPFWVRVDLGVMAVWIQFNVTPKTPLFVGESYPSAGNTINLV